MYVFASFSIQNRFGTTEMEKNKCFFKISNEKNKRKNKFEVVRMKMSVFGVFFKNMFNYFVNNEPIP